MAERDKRKLILATNNEKLCKENHWDSQKLFEKNAKILSKLTMKSGNTVAISRFTMMQGDRRVNTTELFPFDLSEKTNLSSILFNIGQNGKLYEPQNSMSFYLGFDDDGNVIPRLTFHSAINHDGIETRSANTIEFFVLNHDITHDDYVRKANELLSNEDFKGFKELNEQHLDRNTLGDIMVTRLHATPEQFKEYEFEYPEQHRESTIQDLNAKKQDAQKQNHKTQKTKNDELSK